MELRGCIGSFSPLDLADKLKEFALVSAMEDDRFGPIESSELKHLHCTLSLLVRFATEPLKNPLDWQIGKHGVTLEIVAQNGQVHSSTFLPEVPAE